MARVDRVTKRELWSQRLTRYAESRLTVAAFCEREGVSVPSFYEWKRRLRRGGGPGAARVAGGSGWRRTAEPAGNQSALPAFQAITVTPPVSAMTVRLSRGIELQVAADPGVIETVLRQLLELTADDASGGNAAVHHAVVRDAAVDVLGVHDVGVRRC